MLLSGDDNSSDSAEKGYNLEFRSYPNDAWYTVRVLLEGDSSDKLRIKYLPDDHDNVFLAESFKSKDELYDFIGRFRKVSVQLQDPDCSKVVKGLCVCASDYFGNDKIRFYNAIVDDVLHKKHSNVNGKEECSCTFTLFWLHGPNVGIATDKGVADIWLLQGSGLQPELASFIEIALQKIEKASCKSVSSPSNDLPCNLVAQLRENNGSSIVKKKRRFAGSLRQTTATISLGLLPSISTSNCTVRLLPSDMAITQGGGSSQGRQQKLTGSERRRRVRRYQAEQAEQVEPVEQDEQANSEDVEEVVEPYPGGPIDTSILKSFRSHIAFVIWDGQERGNLKVLNHSQKISQWILDDDRSRIRSFVLQSGLGSLVDCSYRTCNNTIISAFCERWQPETNTFHMPFGEMTITLDDVATLLGIPVAGGIVSYRHISVKHANKLLIRLLGVSLTEARAATSTGRGSSVTLQWLRSNFDNVTDSSSDEKIVYATRACLLHLLGCTLFVDKSGSHVAVSLLSCLEDLQAISGYAWGAGALAHMYRQLGLASRSKVHGIGGYMTLLQAWIYEHFPSLSPELNFNYEYSLPRARRWKPRGYGQDVKVLREQLDDLQGNQVCWDPYADSRRYHPLPSITFFTICLKAGDVVEPYHPERVLRQWGYVQTIPPRPLAPFRARRGSTSATYDVVYQFMDQLWQRWTLYVLTEENRGRKCVIPGETAPDYMAWYDSISHRFVQNPTRRSRFQAPLVDFDYSNRLSRAMSRIELLISGNKDVETLTKGLYDLRDILSGSLDAASSSAPLLAPSETAPIPAPPLVTSKITLPPAPISSETAPPVTSGLAPAIRFYTRFRKRRGKPIISDASED